MNKYMEVAKKLSSDNLETSVLEMTLYMIIYIIYQKELQIAVF